MTIRCFTSFRIHKYSICNFITLLNSLNYYIYFLLFCFAGYKTYVIFLISSNNFSDMLQAFTCAREIGNLWNICLDVNIFHRFLLIDLCLAWYTIKKLSLKHLITLFRDLKLKFLIFFNTFFFFLTWFIVYSDFIEI